jgi:glutamyl-tRNA synthetase
LSVVEPWRAELIHAQVIATVEDYDAKLGKLAQPLRVAVSGTAATPPIDETLLLVGKARTLERIDRALVFIDRRTAANA